MRDERKEGERNRTTSRKSREYITTSALHFLAGGIAFCKKVGTPSPRFTQKRPESADCAVNFKRVERKLHRTDHLSRRFANLALVRCSVLFLYNVFFDTKL